MEAFESLLKAPFKSLLKDLSKLYSCALFSRKHFNKAHGVKR